MKKTSAFPLRLPASLKEAAAAISRDEGTSLNQFVSVAVAEKVSAMKTAEFFAAHRDTADVEAAWRIVHRQGGQPPQSDDRLS